MCEFTHGQRKRSDIGMLLPPPGAVSFDERGRFIDREGNRVRHPKPTGPIPKLVDPAMIGFTADDWPEEDDHA